MKRILLKLGVAICIISSIFSMGIFVKAEGTDPTVSVSSVTAIPGDTVVISVDIANNPGIQAMSFTLSYDPDIVTFQEFTNGKFSGVMTQNHQDNGYFSFVNCDTKNVYYNGMIFSLTFKVNEDAAPGDYAFKIQNISPSQKGDDLTGCFANSEHTAITPIVSNGRITVGETCSNSGHKFSEWVETVKPSCEGKGAKTRSCTREGCGHTELKEIAALGHDFEDKWTVDKAATETEKGVMSRHCKNCSAVKDETPFALEISEEKDFKNEEQEIVTPDKWEVLEEIIELEKEEEKAEQEKVKESEKTDKASDSSSSPGRVFSPTVIYIAIALAAVAAIAVVLIIMIRGKRRK